MTDRQPTLDELRALLPVKGGSKRRGLYAAAPGTGPAGKTCRSCAHKTYTGGRKWHPKCGLTKYTHGDATTIRTSTPACKHYQEPAPRPERPGSVPRETNLHLILRRTV